MRDLDRLKCIQAVVDGDLKKAPPNPILDIRPGRFYLAGNGHICNWTRQVIDLGDFLWRYVMPSGGQRPQRSTLRPDLPKRGVVNRAR
jgi:hypothetical protein